MFVVKRDGRKEQVKFDKILRRITRVCKDLKNVDAHVITQKVIQGVYDGVTSKELDRQAIEVAYSMSVKHPEFDKLALRLSISSLHKDTANTFSDCIEQLYNAKDPFGNPKSIIAEDIYKIVKKHAHILNNAIDYSRDYDFDYFGYRTLERSYLLKINEWDESGNHYKKIAERPQHLWMRVSVGIHGNDVEAAINTYNMLSTFQATHATPTLFNAGTIKNQMSSCFLMSLKDNEDSIPGIYDALKEAALISQSAGGIGIHVHKVRSKGSPIYGTGGVSNGIIPMLKNFNETMRYIDQCFTGDTIVYTTDGIKKISEIVIGDEVFGSSGKKNKVKKVFGNSFKGHGVSLSLDGVKKIKVRRNHPLFVLRKGGKNIEQKAEWIDSEDINQGDYLGFPINFESEDLGYSEEDCKFLAYFSQGGSGKIDNSLFYMWVKDERIEKFTDYYLKSRGIGFNKQNYSYWDPTSMPGSKIHNIIKNVYDDFFLRSWEPHTNFKFSLSSIFHDKNCGTFHKSILNLPKEQCKIIADIVLELSDRVFCSTDTRLEQFRFLLLKNGIFTNVIPPSISKKSNVYELVENHNTFVRDNYLFVKIEEVSETYIDEIVYDLEVEPDHDYVTEIGIAHNGGGKRKGSAAIYLEPWHADIFEFLDLRKNNGKEELRARDLNLAIWAPDLFFKRVKDDGNWTLMDPNRCKGLSDVYGEQFDKLYTEYEEKNFGERTVKARELWAKVLESCVETGQPYILAKDACNKKSNQQNLGTLKSSNLCAEIIEYSSPTETSVCNLASISLPACLDGKKTKKFNFEKLEQITATLTENLNKVIDIEYYPVETAKNSNLKHRPIGIGVQGLGTLFAQLRLPWESEEAKQLNKDIFETMYYSFLKKSNELAKKTKKTYDSFKGSPLSEGKFQFDLWNVAPSDRYDWEALRKSIKKYGLMNSLGIAVMPTASCTSVQCSIQLADDSVKTIAKILEEDGIDWKKIEKIDQPLSIPLNNPVDVKTLTGSSCSKIVHYNGYKEVYDIEFEDGKIYSFTENHQLLINRNEEQIWVTVKNLRENDDVVQI